MTTHQQAKRAREDAGPARARATWVRESITSLVSSGHRPAPEDIAALPERFRPRAEEIVNAAVELWDRGDQGPAQALALEHFSALADDLPATWAPPEADDPIAMAAQIRRV